MQASVHTHACAYTHAGSGCAFDWLVFLVARHLPRFLRLGGLGKKQEGHEIKPKDGLGDGGTVE